MNRIFAYFLALVFLSVSCQKVSDGPAEDGYDRDFIYFFMRDVQYGDPSTKAIIENTETLKTLKLPLRVVDETNVATPFNGSVQMAWDDASKLWPAKRNGSSVAWQNKNYSFYSWIQSPGTGTGAGTVSYGTNIKPADKVSLTQPSSYVHSDEVLDEVWADFLMSYVVPVDGRARPLVEFEMERITAGVEVYVSTPLAVDMTITQISITEVVHSADYSLVHHDLANSGRTGIRNNWLTTEKATTTYTRTESVPVKRRTTEDMFDSKFNVMRFITIPQSVKSELTINYTSNGRTYTESFNLAAVPTVRRWDRGRKTRYYINLDTSVGLEAKVAEWVSVDFIEGTFLPWLPEGD